MQFYLRLGRSVVFVFLALSCASRPEIIQLEIQKSALAAKNGIQVVLRTVEDARVFNEDGRRLDAPSLRSRPAEAAALQARTVGRKRNMYNDPEGEWLLDRDRTVGDIIAELTETVLAAEGYEVLRDPLDAKPDAVVLDISVREYWAWSEAKAFYAAIHARTVVTLTITPDIAPPQTLRAESTRQARVPGKYDWQETFRAMHGEYLLALGELLTRNPIAPPEPDFSEDAPLPPTDVDTDPENQSDETETEAAEEPTPTPTTKSAADGSQP